MTPDESPKLHIDSDWKAQAQAEKERLAAEERRKTAEKEAAGGSGGMPEANFRTLVSVLASQAIMGLGAYADPKSGRVVVDLEGARFSIDLLGVLEEKTKGNLEKEEAEEIKQLLAELRSRYVQIAQLVAEQQGKQAVGAGAGAASAGGQEQGKPSIEA